MVVTSEALGAWRTGLAGYRPKCLIKPVGFKPIDLKDVSESAAVTMFGREFQVVGAVQRKARSCKACCLSYSLLWTTVADLLS